MRWFRDNIGQGAWLALLALVVNLGLSFGHVHAIEAKGSEQGPIVLAGDTSHGGPTPAHRDEGQADYLCPICTAVAAMASPLAAAPPSLPAEFAGVTLDQPIVSVPAVADPPAAAFQSRGPPVS